MLKILDEKIRKTPENIEKEYPNYKFYRYSKYGWIFILYQRR